MTWFFRYGKPVNDPLGLGTFYPTLPIHMLLSGQILMGLFTLFYVTPDLKSSNQFIKIIIYTDESCLENKKLNSLN